MEGDRDTRRLSENAIVGAGIAGTTLAIALRQSGLPVRLYDLPDQHELAGRPSPTDAPLLLTANGTRVLHAIGLKEDLSGIALTPQFSTLRHARTGFLLSQRPLGAFSEARYGAPDILVGGARLVQLLRQHAAALGIPLEREAPVTDVEAGTATLTLADGRKVRHQSVAVACGLPKAPSVPGIADLLNERHWVGSNNLIALRASGNRLEPNRDHDRFINTWVADGLIAVEMPCPESLQAADRSDDQRVTLTLLAPVDDRAGEDASAHVMLERLLQRAHPHLRGLMVDPVIERLIEPSAEIADYWFAEKLVLLGGACHAHPGFPALNASAALEDAWVLSRMMERWEESPHEGFADYERYRKPRARRLRNFAQAERKLFAERSGIAAWQRNLKWSLTSRFLPEIALQRLDWLYGYDCIRGFA